MFLDDDILFFTFPPYPFKFFLQVLVLLLDDLHLNPALLNLHIQLLHPGLYLNVGIVILPVIAVPGRQPLGVVSFQSALIIVELIQLAPLRVLELEGGVIDMGKHVPDLLVVAVTLSEEGEIEIPTAEVI